MLNRFIVSLFAGLTWLASQVGPVHAQSVGHHEAQAQSVLLEMADAFKRNDRKRLSALLPQTRGHLLEPWAAYWELRARLDDASTTEVRQFLSRYAGTYQEDRLRNDWLMLLGNRRDWSTFESEQSHYRMRDDRELRCYELVLQHQKNPAAFGPDGVKEVLSLWRTMMHADDGCTLAAEKLLEDRKIKPLEVWRKARLAIENNRPVTARNAVQLVAPKLLNAVKDVHAQPGRFLNQNASHPRNAVQELVVLALVRLASSDPDEAYKQMQRTWAIHLTTEERHWVWGAIGRQLAMRLDDNALKAYEQAHSDHDLTDDMLAWKVRAALRASPKTAWKSVESAILAMDANQRQEPVWVYWLGRALQARGHKDQAHTLWEGIASAKGFYEQLALEELGRSIQMPTRPALPTAEEMAQARANPSLQRAVKAIAMGLRSEGVREWNYGTNLVNAQGHAGRMNDRELLAAAHWACELEIWDRCINTSDRTSMAQFDPVLRYPMPFQTAVVQRAQEIQLDPAFVYGLIRQESRFIMDARSHVGASGLMQVMPATARWTAKKIGLKTFTLDQLNQRDTNIAIGTAYLKLVLESMDNSMAMAAAAYNAGPSRPRRWRAPDQGRGPVLEAAIWAENIPFNETRDYVKKVLANTTNYAALITGQPQSLKARLGKVGPRDASAPPEDTDLP
jgi:soluble lytic murein transglycosylase